MANKIRLFIDPGSNSTGWAVVDEESKCILETGTIRAHKNHEVWERLDEIGAGYYVLANELGSRYDAWGSKVHIERMNRNVNVAVVWSVAAIAVNLMPWGFFIDEQISPTAWQKTVKWNKAHTKKNWVKNKLAKRYNTDSEDEAAAIGLALHWIKTQKEIK